jgi:hypothetical protein
MHLDEKFQVQQGKFVLIIFVIDDNTILVIDVWHKIICEGLIKKRKTFIVSCQNS